MKTNLPAVDDDSDLVSDDSDVVSHDSDVVGNVDRVIMWTGGSVDVESVVLAGSVEVIVDGIP